MPSTLRTPSVSNVTPKSVSKFFLSNQSNGNSQDSGKKVRKSSGPSNLGSSVPQRHKMVGDDMNLPIFNGNGLEDLEQHFFLCESIQLFTTFIIQPSYNNFN